MTNSRISVLAALLAALAAGSFVSANAIAQTPEGKFRGAYVCEKLPLTRNILRTPLDLVIRGKEVQFARPLFNLRGTRVVGSELGAGTVDDGGTLHLRSEWTFRGNIAHADYSGTLTPSGGTLAGTQTWSSRNGGQTVTRTCTAALVPTRPAATSRQ